MIRSRLLRYRLIRLFALPEESLMAQLLERLMETIECIIVANLCLMEGQKSGPHASSVLNG